MYTGFPRGGVTLRVLFHEGKEAIVARLGPGDFFGEGALSGQPVRMATAIASSASALLVVEQHQMIRLLYEEPAPSDRFPACVLGRNIRVEADLVGQVFNSSEKRLARTLLLLAQYGRRETPYRVLPRTWQETLAEMTGMIRSRENFSMNTFKKLGYIAYYGTYTLEQSRGVVTHHVQGALFPNWVGGDQVRHFRMDGDRLTIGTPTVRIGGEDSTTVLVWERSRQGEQG